MKSNKNTICMVAYTHYSIDPRVKRAANCLSENGYRVDIFTLNENKKISKRNSINIHYAGMNKYLGNSNIRYLISYLLFFLKTFMFLNKTLLISHYKIIHFHNMPNFIIFASVFHKLFGSKIILDIHDSMPELYSSKYSNPLYKKIFYIILIIEEKISSMFADKIISVSDPFKKDILRKHGIKPEDVLTIMNLADENIFHPAKNTNKEEIDGLNIIYHGSLSSRFNISMIIKCINLMKDYYPVYLEIYGEGEDFHNIKKQIELFDLKNNIKLNKAIPLEDIPEKIENADIGIISYSKTEATEYMLPTKLLEYMSMEKTALTIKNRAISYYFSGKEIIYYEANNIASLYKEIKRIVDDPKILERMKLSIKEFNKKYNWKNERLKYLTVVKNL